MREIMTAQMRERLVKLLSRIRKKKNETVSRMRLSITFITALNYTKLFIIFGAIILLLFGLVFLFLFDYENDKKIEKVKESIISIAADNYREADFSVANDYRDDGLEIKIIESSTRSVLYSDTDEKLNKDANVFGRIYIMGNGSDKQFIICTSDMVKVPYKMDDVTLELEFRVDFSNEINIYYKSMKFMIVVIGVLAIIISLSGARQMRFIMQPINNMSNAANTLNVSNLSSKRLNVEGAQNELKDLAVTINDMLDRIDISYESQKQFVSDASHELRTPIAVIQGYVNMIDRWGKDDPIVMDEAIQSIKEEAANMKELVEKLLFLSRHDKKTLKLKKEFFNMKDVADELLKETIMVAPNRNVRTNALEDVMVYGDKQSLKQAVRIFIDNAVKYSEDGDSIIISCKNDNGKCIMTVEDSGIGMRKKDIQKIFERFYRADDVRDRSISGHGLGLSIAKLIIMRHTGVIRVRSKYRVGTCFTVELPRTYR